MTAVVVTPTTAQAAAPEHREAIGQRVGALDLGTQLTVKEAATKTSKAKSAARAAKAGQAKAAAAASSKARKAVAYAKAQLGDQYRWGGAGPRYFDCSGLTMMAWRQAGVKLPHRAKLQYRRGRHVPKSRLLPGDLLFFYRSKSHVGIYIGGGRMIHAANPRADILVSRVSSGYYARAFVGARRMG